MRSVCGAMLLADLLPEKRAAVCSRHDGMRRPPKYRKVSEAAFERLHEEACKRIAVTPYKKLAKDLGIALGTVENVVSRMIQDIRAGKALVYRGTQQVHKLADEMELRA